MGGGSTGEIYYGTYNMSTTFMDEPNTTSAVTYKAQWLVQSDTGYLNRPHTDSNLTYYVVGASSATSEGGGRTCEFSFNFGNPAFSISTSQADDAGYGNFEYDVPAGYYSICTKNLANYG